MGILTEPTEAELRKYGTSKLQAGQSTLREAAIIVLIIDSIDNLCFNMKHSYT